MLHLQIAILFKRRKKLFFFDYHKVIKSLKNAFSLLKKFRPQRVNQSISNRNNKVQSKSMNRWCSFCSSSSHTWPYCYSNPDTPHDRSTYAPSVSPPNHLSSSPSRQLSYLPHLNINEFVDQPRTSQHHQSSPSPLMSKNF